MNREIVMKALAFGAWMICLLRSAVVLAEPPAPMILFDPAAPGIAKTLEPTSAQVTPTVGADGLTITIASGPEGYPGVVIKPAGAAVWDLSAFGHLQTTVTNLGTKAGNLILQPECDGDWRDNPYSAQAVWLKPGESKPLTVLFGYFYDKKAPKFQPVAVKDIRIYTVKTDSERKFRIAELQAAGAAGEKPWVDPNRLAVKPAKGLLFDAATTIDAARQLVAKGGAKGTLSADGKAIQISFAGGREESVSFKPVAGMWNLSQGLQVRVKLRNDGQVAVTPGVRLESRRDGQFDLGDITSVALAPGAEAEVVVPFIAKVTWKGVAVKAQEVLEGRGTWGGEPGTGNGGYRSNQTTALTVVSDTTPGAKSLQILAVVCDMPSRQLPAWLGQRPPVDGQWTKTFEDNFTGDALDLTKWNRYGDNYWDSQTHFSKDNVIVKDGKLTLRVEHKRGHQNDDPQGKETDYATGFADTYGKWTQRYGYFEARVKLPTAPNMFYAFWLMPDRGVATGPQWKRADTGNGGMEFDIMEGLSIWGANRHDFGCHWDGYDKTHKSNGLFNCYAQTDAEGFFVVGMLWTPGLVVQYDNGVETARWESPRISQVQSYMILDHVTGGWETEGMDDSKLPADLVVSYVRAWQRKDLASAEDGCKAAATPTTKPAGQ